MHTNDSPSLTPDSVINPNSVPKGKLACGAEIPLVGMGTFGSDKYTAAQIADAVLDGARSGYRHFDCAAVYRNEKEVGEAFRKITSEGINREELWITSKLWNDKHAEEDVLPACQQSLADLGLDYLDLYMIHWPFPNFHGPGVDASARDPHARPYIHSDYMKTWRQCERLVELGLVRHIGVSNMTVPKMELLLRDAAIPPACCELELHPHFQQPELYRYLVEHSVFPIGYSPIGSPSRPERDRTPDDTVDIEDPVIVSIAQRLGLHPATVCVKWGVQKGHAVIPFSVKRPQYMASLQAAVSPPLTQADMEAIAGIDRNNRLIKGHVFLWKDGQTWEALWDTDGVITPA